jgi:hypothetical protein
MHPKLRQGSAIRAEIFWESISTANKQFPRLAEASLSNLAFEGVPRV